MDKNYNIVRYTPPFGFMNNLIEFCCGLAEYNDDLLITFGVQYNAAYILRCPKKIVEDAL